MSVAVVHQGEALHPRRRLAIVVILGSLVALGPFTTDLYLPAFPSVRAAFGVSDVAIQLTLSGTALGFGLGQLLVGPWSDRIGRRTPLLIATSLHVVTCLLAALAPDVTVLALLRVLQGVGAAGAGVVAQAAVRDLFGGQPLVRMLARMGLVSGVAPVIAPLVGSQLLAFLDWRGLFVSLAIYGAAALGVAAIGIGETRPTASRHRPGHDTARARYRAVFHDRVFVGTAIAGGMQFSGVFAYLSSSPFLFQEVYGFTPQQYGLLFASNSIGIVAGSQTSARLMRRIGPQWILTWAVLAQTVCGLTLVVFGGVGAPLPLLLCTLFVYITACGFGLPCVPVLGLVRHGEEAGTAASVLGAANFGLAGLVSPIVGALGIASGVPMGLVITGAAIVAVVSVVVVVRPRSVPAIGR